MRTALRTSPMYAWWRGYRERQQLQRFQRLLDEHLSGGQSSARYSEYGTVARLSELRQRRRSIHPYRPRVVGFGACDWEQHGLWPAFERISDFSLWQYRKPHHVVANADRTYRSRLAHRFLEHIDELDRDGPVQCVFFYASGVHIADELLDALDGRGIWSVIMSLDDKHQFSYPVDPETGRSHQLRVASQCDLYWTTWKTGTQIVLRAGGTPWYAAEGANPDFHRPVDVPRDLDIVFIGSAYGIRSDLVRYLRRRGFTIEAFGSGWPNGFVSFEQTVELYGRAHVVLSSGAVGQMPGVKHLKGRDFEVPMCGALYLTSFNPELADHFEIGREILCYGSFEECADILHWILRQPEEAAAIRNAALLRSRRDHTWQGRLSHLLHRLLPAASAP